jgi:hypothetical protein
MKRQMEAECPDECDFPSPDECGFPSPDESEFPSHFESPDELQSEVRNDFLVLEFDPIVTQREAFGTIVLDWTKLLQRDCLDIPVPFSGNIRMEAIAKMAQKIGILY